MVDKMDGRWSINSRQMDVQPIIIPRTTTTTMSSIKEMSQDSHLLPALTISTPSMKCSPLAIYEMPSTRHLYEMLPTRHLQNAPHTPSIRNAPHSQEVATILCLLSTPSLYLFTSIVYLMSLLLGQLRPIRQSLPSHAITILVHALMRAAIDNGN